MVEMKNPPEPITIYVGTYTRRESFVDGKAEGIYVYRMDPLSGMLTHTATVPGTINPSYVVVSAEKEYLYAVNELTAEHGAHGTVTAFAIDPVTKNLNSLNKQSTHGFAPCYLSIDDTGRFILVANYESGSLCVMPIEADGRLGEATDVVQHHGSGLNAERQEGPHAHMILSGPDCRTIFTVDLGIDKILPYDLDRQHGKLLPIDSAVTQLAPGTGPRHLTFHPNGRFAYVISELQSTVISFRIGARRGTLEELQTVSTLPAGFTGENSGAEIQAAPSGRFVYASNRGHDSIAIFAVDEATGTLSLVGHEPTQGVGPRNFAIDPSGMFLLVANQDSDTIVTFRIDQETGQLRQAGDVADAPTPVCIQFA
jgi:6-phosphogluconolactonase